MSNIKNIVFIAVVNNGSNTYDAVAQSVCINLQKKKIQLLPLKCLLTMHRSKIEKSEPSKRIRMPIFYQMYYNCNK